MAQTGFTPIQLYRTTTASATPSAGNLADGELAINTNDGRLFYKDNGGVVQTIAWKTTPVSAGGTGTTTLTGYVKGSGTSALTASATVPGSDISGVVAAVNGGTGQSGYTTGDILFASDATTLSKLADVATGNVLISGGVGVAPTYGKVGLTTHVSGTLPVANGGTGQSGYTTGDILFASDATTLSKLSDVATGNVLISGGVGVAPTYGKVGLTTHVNGTLPVANGGTGATDAATARTNLGVVALAGDTMTGNLTVPSINNGPLAGFRNAIINGNFDIWQRGTSFSNPAFNAYTADRWVVTYNGTGATRTLSRQTFTPGQTDVPYNPKYFFRYNQSVAGTGGTYSVIEQRIEGVNTFAGQQVTLSFYAKAGASISLPSLDVAQVFGTGGSPSTAVVTNINGAQAITTSWAKYQYTFTVPSISGKTLGTNGDDALYLYIAVPVNSTFTFDLAQVQLEAGPVATPFERRPIGTELALCQRYYQQYQDPPARGVASSATQISRVGFSLPVIMRVAPTGSLSGSLNWFDGTGTVTISALLNTFSTPHSFEFDATTAGTAAYRPIIIYISGNTGTINLSAEL